MVDGMAHEIRVNLIQDPSDPDAEIPVLDLDGLTLLLASEEVRPDLLTTKEKAVVEKAGELWGDLCRIVSDDVTRNADLAELIVHIHAIQRYVMAQAAARAYPEDYRLMGDIIRTRMSDAARGIHG